jgi:hypothetical protein
VSRDPLLVDARARRASSRPAFASAKRSREREPDSGAAARDQDRLALELHRVPADARTRTGDPFITSEVLRFGEFLRNDDR